MAYEKNNINNFYKQSRYYKSTKCSRTAPIIPEVLYVEKVSTVTGAVRGRLGADPHTNDSAYIL